MAVGITTTDGKDLDDRYIRTISGKGPDANGNVVVDVPVTSVQGKTGDVTLGLVTNGADVTATATPTNNSTYTYTVTKEGFADIHAQAGTGRSQYTTGGGEEETTVHYRNEGSTKLTVKLNDTTLFEKTTSGDSTVFSKTNLYVNVGDTISVLCYRSKSSYAISHSFSFKMTPTIIV